MIAHQMSARRRHEGGELAQEVERGGSEGYGPPRRRRGYSAAGRVTRTGVPFTLMQSGTPMYWK